MRRYCIQADGNSKDPRAADEYPVYERLEIMVDNALPPEDVQRQNDTERTARPIGPKIKAPASSML